MRFSKVLLSALTTIAFAGCIDSGESETSGAASSTPGAPGAPSANGVQPRSYPGNFVSENDTQICYDISELNGAGITSEMKGFKIDPPVTTTNAAGTFTITQPFLAFDAADNMVILGVIVKGGPNYNLYDYFPGGETNDSLLHAPLNSKGRPSAISHYNVCYQPTTPPVGAQGCTPGYWRNHADRWLGASPSDNYNTTFGVSSVMGPAFTLGQGVQDNGGGEHALARHATAGLLNSFGGIPNEDGTTVAYPYTTAQVKAIVQAAYATPDNLDTVADEHAQAIEAAKNQLANANELGCPLSGTRALKV